MTKKEKFKKYSIKALWIILLGILLYIEGNFIMASLDFICYDINGYTIFNDVSLFDASLPGYGFIGLLFLMICFRLSEIPLYIFSYKIYTGKYNWYKVFRDREKQQKLQNNIDWKQYLKDLKNKNK